MDQLKLADTSLQRLRTFVAVVDRAGYSAAAAHLGMTQPSVSYHVRSLEQTLGATLVIYRNRSIHLTPEGHEVYRTASTILNEGERLEGRIAVMRSGQVGHLGLGASIAFEHQFFFDLIIGPYVDEHRGVHLRLRFAHSKDLVERVANGALDIAYVNDWQIPSELVYEPLHLSNLIFLVAPDHPLASKGTVSPEDINDAGLIVAPIDPGEVISYHEMLSTSGVRNPRSMLEIDGIQARKLATQAGLGILATFAPDYAGEHAMDPLRTLRLKGKTPTIEFGLVTRPAQPWTPLMTDMAQRLRNTASAG